MRGKVFYCLVIMLAAIKLTAQPSLTITIDLKQKAQTIHNIGASGCWYSEPVGRYWPEAAKEKMAELLFSRAFDTNGNPQGIGLSAWRFNIGGGTEEQGDSSGIHDRWRRVECFMDATGRFDWNKQPGYQWFLRKAKTYGVENLIAFSNTPPVSLTSNHLGFKLEKDYKVNLPYKNFSAYADFLTTVLQHFDKEGLHFNYISPVNEPQWDWSDEFGKGGQEGTPWNNADISHISTALDSSLSAKKLDTRIMISEAGMLTYLYGGRTGTSHQIQTLLGGDSALSIRHLKHVPAFIGGHSYFTENGDSSLIAIRKQVADTCTRYGIEYWQTEYSMLGDGFRESTKSNRSSMDCALFLAKVIHHDISIGNAAAWQLWNAWEPGRADSNTRYYLIALKPNHDFTNGSFVPVKNLWALGQYSFFIRPGMQRLVINRSDNATDEKAAQGVMVSAYTGKNDHQIILVAINYTQQKQPLSIALKQPGKSAYLESFTTTAVPDENMKAGGKRLLKDGMILPERSITTILINR